MFTLCDDVNLTPSSTPVPELPSPSFVQQKLLVSREKLPQSVAVAVYVEDHKPGTAVAAAADAVCVTVTAASANTLSVITMCRTRTSIPLCTACANAGVPRDSAWAAPCARALCITNPMLVNRKNRFAKGKGIGPSRAVSLIQPYRPGMSEASGMPGVGGSRRYSHDALTAKVIMGTRSLAL